jgi:hypothetical protein
MKRHLIALGVAVAAPLAGMVAMTAATAAVAHAIITGSLVHHPQGHR